MSSQLQNSTLLTQSFVGEKEGSNDHFIGLTIFHIFLAFWVGVSNSSQIINIIFSPSLRREPKNILICNVCVADLIVGVFLCPMYTDTLMQGIWRHDLKTCAVYEVTFYCQVCVATLAVLMVAVERLYFILTPNMMEGSGSRCMTTILVLLPWITGAGLVVPIFKFGTVVVPAERAGPCQLMWKSKFQRVIGFTSFVCPALLLVSVVIGLHALHAIMKVHAKRRDLGPHPEKQAIKETLRVVFLSSLTSVSFQFPFFVVFFTAEFCEPAAESFVDTSCQDAIDTSTWAVAMAILMLKAGATPVVWMTYADIRLGFQQGIGGVIFSCGGIKNEDARGGCHSNTNSDPHLNNLSLGQSQQAILTSSSV